MSHMRRKAHGTAVGCLSREIVFYIPHEPGAPPQRPQVGAGSASRFPAVSLATANTLNFREVCIEPHSGQGGFGPSVIDRWRCSNPFLQVPQVYS